MAKEIGMSKPGLYIAIEKERLTVEILEKIAQALDVPVTIFFNLSRVDWVPVSEVDILNNEITRLLNRLKEVEEQLEERRAFLKIINTNNLINKEDLNSLIHEAVKEQLERTGNILIEEEEYVAMKKEEESLAIKSELPSPESEVTIEKIGGSYVMKNSQSTKEKK